MTHSHSTVQLPTRQSMEMLSTLLLASRAGDEAYSWRTEELKAELSEISLERFSELAALANSNHVIVRGMERFLEFMREGQDERRAEWAQIALDTEKARIVTALRFLEEICTAFEMDGYDVAVIKSLDHWPDIGSDLDLYTNARSEDIAKL